MQAITINVFIWEPHKVNDEVSEKLGVTKLSSLIRSTHLTAHFVFQDGCRHHDRLSNQDIYSEVYALILERAPLHHRSAD